MKRLLIIIPIILNTYLCTGQFLSNDTVIKKDTLISNLLKINLTENSISKFYITLENDTVEVDEIKFHGGGGLLLKIIRCYKDGVKTKLKPEEIKGFKKNNEIYISGREKDEKKITFFKVVPMKSWFIYERSCVVVPPSTSEYGPQGAAQINTIIYYRIPNTDPPVFQFNGSR